MLSDEAYFEMRYAGKSTSIASIPRMAGRTFILYTFSCTTHFVQVAGVEALRIGRLAEWARKG